MREEKDKDMKICVSGLTASGKTTLAEALHRYFGCTIFRASSQLLAVVCDRAPTTKEERLLSWLTPNHVLDAVQRSERAKRLTNPADDRFVDQNVLDIAKKTTDSLIFESLTLPFLYPRPNDLFSVLLLASEKRRSQHLFSILPTLSQEQRKTIIQRKDEQTRQAIMLAWNKKVYDPSLYPFYDVIINETTPLTAAQIAEVIIAAVSVYQCYQEQVTASFYANALTTFRQSSTRMASTLLFSHPLLSLPGGTPATWFYRKDCVKGLRA